MTLRQAQLISFLVHPALMPLVVYGLVLFATDVPMGYSTNTRLTILGVVFLFTFITPGFTLMVFKQAGVISSYYLPDRRERPFPFLVSTLHYTLLALFFHLKGVEPPALMAIILGISLALFVLTLVSLRFQMSAHGLGIGGAVGSLVGLHLAYGLPELLLPIALLVLLSGLTLSARLYLQAHTPAEAYSGLLTGAGVCALTILLTG